MRTSLKQLSPDSLKMPSLRSLTQTLKFSARMMRVSKMKATEARQASKLARLSTETTLI